MLIDLKKYNEYIAARRNVRGDGGNREDHYRRALALHCELFYSDKQHPSYIFPMEHGVVFSAVCIDVPHPLGW
jgi:hypothetical protein